MLVRCVWSALGRQLCFHRSYRKSPRVTRKACSRSAVSLDQTMGATEAQPEAWHVVVGVFGVNKPHFEQGSPP